MRSSLLRAARYGTLRVRDAWSCFNQLPRVRPPSLSRREHKYVKLAVMLSIYTPGFHIAQGFPKGEVEYIAAEIATSDAFLAGGTDPMEFPESFEDVRVEQFFNWADRDKDGVVNMVCFAASGLNMRAKRIRTHLSDAPARQTFKDTSKGARNV